MRLVSLLFHDVYERDPRESGFASAAADRYKLPVADFDAQLAGLAEVFRGPQPFDTLRVAPSIVEGQGSAPHHEGSAPHQEGSVPFRITVDDGGLSYYTLVADRLEALGWRGCCFVTTNVIATRGFLDAARIRELDARGHVIGSHSASHPARFSALTGDEMRQEWSDSRAALEDILGHPVEVASVPGGYFSTAVARAAGEAGLRMLFTSEPTATSAIENGCSVIGRFTIRRGHHPDIARKLVQPAPWTRCGAWASWNAKGLVKPLLGPSYMRVADWVLRKPAAFAPCASASRAVAERRREGLRLPGRL